MKTKHNIEKFFIPFLFFLLILGMTSGLARGGALNLPSLSEKHFIIFLYGFFGSLLSLERAFGFSLKYLFITPALTLLGTILYIWLENPYLIIPGALLFILPNLRVFITSKSFFSSGFILSAILFITGAIFFASGYYYQSAIALVLFLVFYILSERAELIKIIGLGKNGILFLSLASIMSVTGLIISLKDLISGIQISFGSIAAITVWFMRNDIARKTIKMKGIVKFSAISVLSAYFWLLIGSLLISFFGMNLWGEGVHSITLGFVFSMIFAHAPSIFPSMMRLKFQFSPILYIPLLFLNISVALRNISYLTPKIKKSTLLLNSIAIISFFFFFILTLKKNKKIAGQNPKKQT